MYYSTCIYLLNPDAVFFILNITEHHDAYLVNKRPCYFLKLLFNFIIAFIKRKQEIKGIFSILITCPIIVI